MFALLVISLNIVCSVPPQTVSDTTLDIESAYPTYHKINDDLYVHVHVFNTINEGLVTSDINCYYHVYNHQLNGDQHIVKGTLDLYGMGYSDIVNGSIINQTGEYSVLAWCNSSTESTEVGYNKYTFKVNPTGQELETSNSFIYIAVGFVLLILLIFLINNIFNTYNKYFKYSCIGISYVILHVFLLILWKVSEAFLYIVPFIETLFEILYNIVTIGYFIFFPVLFFFMLMDHFNEKQFGRLRKMGYSDDDIKFHQGRNKR